MSAILCTYNRASLLGCALGALCAQTLGREQFEVIVIDDGSTDQTAAVAERFADLLRLRYAYQDNSGLAAAKNHGVCLARGEIVVFVDDDDVLDSRCLQAHYETHQRHPAVADAVLGFTGLAAGPGRSPLMRYVTEVGCQLFYYPHLKHDAKLDYSFFWGGRSSCKRRLLLEHGVFNPVFRFGAEDIELGYRLRSVGLRVIYNANAISYMMRTLSFDDFCRRCYLQGRSNQVFATLHPQREVQAWAQLKGIEAEWRLIEPRFDLLMQSGRKLDRFATERSRVDLPLDKLSTQLLHRAYAAAFTANRIRGSIDMQGEAPVSAGRSDAGIAA
ncbi:glycosyltransferase family 2 protein [Thiohalocapsa marina]|uniref:glycosyltransferase family 2 protein n=1 Tax=Thiohalocapsa marina TaxID=424902 RepID=UPI0014783DFD|nr:glycosyltransferase family 2 protein [Thiohalocapsa marina]